MTAAHPPLLPALILLLAAPARAQEAPPAVFMDAVDVRVVNVEVVVTDARGNRVTGLAPGDFRLFVDRQEVPVEYFTEVVGGRARAAREEGAVAGMPALAPGEAVERSYLVFIDEHFSLARDRDRVVRSLIDQLETLHPGDRMAIVAYDGRELTMLSSWSSSRQELRRTLLAALERPTYGMQRQAERRSFTQMMRVAGEEGGMGVDVVYEMQLRAHSQRLEQQVQATTAAAAATLRSFANPPGRKVMLLLSGGWPYSASGLLTGLSQGDRDDDEWTDVEQLYGPLAATANRLGYTIYAVDVPDSGLAFSAIDASAERYDSPGTGIDAALQQGLELRLPLELLSSRTGGRALLGGERETALARAAEDTESYYWLGFTPTWREDDHAHGIRVEVRQPGLRVRARTSFLDLSRVRSAQMMLESALLFDATPQPHALPVKLGEPQRSRRRSLELPVSLAIPVDAVAFLPSGGGYVAELELLIALRDGSGRETGEIAPIAFQVRVPTAPPAGTYVRYDTRIQLRSERHRIALAVRDRVGGALLTGLAELTP